MDELPGRDMSKVPHPLVQHTMALLQDQPASERAKVWFIHMNHGNPLLWADSPQSRSVLGNGFNIARECLRLPL
jgi:pyrroloquinoline quinone biosynthesis protein B